MNKNNSYKRLKYYFIFSLFDSISNLKQNYFNVENWKKWYISFVIDNPVNSKGQINLKKEKIKWNNGENYKNDKSFAVEVYDYRKKLIYFGGNFKF
jgi:hypothetical protein